MEMTLTEPTKLRAGDTWAWSRTESAYPASLWTLTYHVHGAAAKFDIVAVASGDSFAVSSPIATTAAIKPGRYRWVARVTDGVSAHTIDEGTLDVLENLAVSGVIDSRSHARKMLDAIEAALEGRAKADQLDLLSSSMGSVSASRDARQLMEMRMKYREEVRRESAAEQMAQGLGNPRRLYVRVGRA